MKFATSSHTEEIKATGLYAALFAAIYLGLETLFKVFASVIYFFYGLHPSIPSWHLIVFGCYTLAAYCSVIAFGIFVFPISATENNENENCKNSDNKINDKRTYLFSILSEEEEDRTDNDSTYTHNNDINTGKSNGRLNKTLEDEEEREGRERRKGREEGQGREVKEEKDNINDSTNYRNWRLSRILSLKYDFLSVLQAIHRDRILQLMIPYQICFGLSAGFIGYYVNKYVVADELGDGYIGGLTAMSTFIAALSSYVFAGISNLSNGRGKWHVMVFGALCFAVGGLWPLILTDKELSKWKYIVFYYSFHGAARGCWESTNKAIIAEYYPDANERETAFAAVYFTSGLSGAMGYYFYKYMTRQQMVLLNVIVPIIALISYHYSDRLFYINNPLILRDRKNDIISSRAHMILNDIDDTGIEMKMSDNGDNGDYSDTSGCSDNRGYRDIVQGDFRSDFRGDFRGKKRPTPSIWEGNTI